MLSDAQDTCWYNLQNFNIFTCTVHINVGNQLAEKTCETIICKYNPPWQIPYIYIYADTCDTVRRLYCLHHMPEDLNIQETIPKFCYSCRLFGDCTSFTEFSLKLLFSTYLKNKYFIQIIIAFISSISWGGNSVWSCQNLC